MPLAIVEFIGNVSMLFSIKMWLKMYVIPKYLDNFEINCW